MTYAFIKLRSAERSFQPLREALAKDDFAAVAPARVWGTFLGLFGIASNEFVMVTYGSAEDVVASRAALDARADATVVESYILEPTVRPTEDAPRSRAGLYVFRFFDVDNADVQEIAALSNEAWTTFENTDDYSAEPQALWCEHDRSATRGRMLLCTWYDGFDSWQTSRQPAPAARANFQRRHQLTRGTIAFATRLITA